jgi:hypothetical protein
VLIFFIFQSNKIRVNPTDIVYSLFPPWCRLSFSRCHHAATPCHISFLLSQDELATSISSYSNVSSRRLPSQAEIEALNLHHHHMPLSPDRPTPTIHWYKKIISILITLPITQLHLYFVSFVARASYHWSSTRRCHSLAPLFHIYRPSAKRRIRWQTNQSSFAFWITYWYVNSHKKIF